MPTPDRKPQVLFTGLLITLLSLSLLAALQSTRAQPILPGIHTVTAWTCLGTFILAVGFSRAHQRPLSGRQKTFLPGLNAFMLFVLASSLYSPEPWHSAQAAVVMLLMLNTVALSLLHVPDPARLLRACAYLFLAFTVLACLYVVVLMHFEQLFWFSDLQIKRIKIGDISLQRPVYGRRNSSYLGNPNLLGAFIALSLPTAYYLLSTARHRARQLGSALIILLLAYTLWHTASRASTLSALFGLTVFTLLLLEHKSHPIKKPALIGVGLSAIALLGLFLYDKNLLLQALNEVLARKGSLLSGREKAWQLLLESIRTHPLLGIGYDISQQQLLIPGGFTNPYGSHNIYLRIAAETGLIGLVGFLGLILWPLINACRQISNGTAAQPLLLILWVSVGSTFLFHGFFEDNIAPTAALFLYPVVGVVGMVGLGYQIRRS